MRILYCSNAPWSASGYGVQGKSLLPRLRELDEVEDIAMFAWYGLMGGIWEWEGFKIYPAWRDGYGNDMYRAHADDFKADVVITLIDSWVLRDLAKKLDPIKWWPWFPIDHEPVSPYVTKSLEGTDKRLVWCGWAQKLLAAQGIQSDYVPLGIEEDVFKVVEPGDMRGRFRKDYFGEDAEFVVTMVAANKGEDDRKAFGYQLQAFAKFAADKPNVKLYIHTDPTLDSQGVRITNIAKLCGIEDRVIFPDSYRYKMGYPDTWMSALYNSSDLFLGASKSEGFGIPLVEAQACGIPVITSEFSSQPELVRLGATVPIAAKEWCHLNAWRSIPSIDGIHSELQQAYDQWQSNGQEWPMDLRREVSKRIHDDFGWDNVVKNYWHPLIKEAAL